MLSYCIINCISEGDQVAHSTRREFKIFKDHEDTSGHLKGFKMTFDYRFEVTDLKNRSYHFGIYFVNTLLKYVNPINVISYFYADVSV